MSETKEKKHFIGDHYYYTDNGTLYYCEPIVKDGETVGETTTAIANHTPILKEQRIIDNGIETNEELVFNVLRDFHRGVDTAVTLKEILGQTPQAKFGAACRIFLGRGAKSRYSEAMQIQCETAPCSTLYQHTGYTVVDGERVFLNGDNSVTAEGMTNKYNVAFSGQLENYRFTAERHEERYNTLLKLLPSTAPVALIYAGLGLTFLTPLNALLREIGIEPRFILYFTGKTGTRKTTMATLFLNFFGTFDNGITVTLSVQLDIRAMYNTLDKAESYLLAACDDMAKPKAQRNILYNQFYAYNKDMPDEIYSPEYKNYVAFFDHVPQLQEVETEKTQLTPVEKTKLDWLFRDTEEEGEKLQRTRELMEKAPEVTPLLNLSEYAPYVMAVEQMKQEENNGDTDTGDHAE